MLDPVTLYSKDGQSRRIAAIDAPGWIAAGWSTEPFPEEPPKKPTTRKVKDAGDTISEG